MPLADWMGVASEPRLPDVHAWIAEGFAGGGVFASFLPGISQALANLVTTAGTLGQVLGISSAVC